MTYVLLADNRRWKNVPTSVSVSCPDCAAPVVFARNTRLGQCIGCEGGPWCRHPTRGVFQTACNTCGTALGLSPTGVRRLSDPR